MTGGDSRAMSVWTIQTFTEGEPMSAIDILPEVTAGEHERSGILPAASMAGGSVSRNFSCRLRRRSG